MEKYRIVQVEDYEHLVGGETIKGGYLRTQICK